MASNDNINFVETHRPQLMDGDYVISATHTIEVNKNYKNNKKDQQTLNFSVAGPQFKLDPNDIHCVFPPNGGQGEYDNVLAHISLNRSTLPWERTADNKGSNDALSRSILPKERTTDNKDSNDTASWLCLLLFTDKENKNINIQKNTKLGDLMEATHGDVDWPGIKLLETGQKSDDRVTVIDIPVTKNDESFPEVELWCPKRQALSYLTGVREEVKDSKPLEEIAFVMSHRLPKPECSYHAYLVSIEGRYNDTGTLEYRSTSDSIRFVLLHNWHFSVTEDKIFKALENLNVDTFSAKGDSGSLDALPLTHYLRNGQQTISLFNSPLNNRTLPYACNTQQESSLSSDSQLIFDQDNGVFYAAYASAYTLGRFSMLTNKNVYSQLAQWKHTQLVNAQVKAETESGLTDTQANPITESLTEFFSITSILNTLPINYLIPFTSLLSGTESQVLNDESIRFFNIDTNWLDAYRLGAYQVGTFSKHSAPFKDFENALGLDKQYKYSGVIIRSAILPNFIFHWEAYGEGNTKLDLLLERDINATTKCLIFKSSEHIVNKFDIHQKLEAMHFGVDKEKNASRSNLKKTLRDLKTGKPNGKTVKVTFINPDPIIKHDPNADEFIDIAKLAKEIEGATVTQPKYFNTAIFSMEMMGSSEKYRYLCPAASSI